MVDKQLIPVLFVILGSGGDGSDGTNLPVEPEPITPPASNAPPIFSATEYSFEVQEGSIRVGSVAASDPDGDQVKYELSGPDSTSFSVNSTGYLSFLASPDFEAPTDTDSNNEYELVVAASDSSLTTEVSVTITVTNDTSDDPVSNSPPVFNENPIVFEVTEAGSTTVGLLTATDPDGDALVYSLSGADSENFDISGRTISFLEAPDFEAPRDEDEDNIYLFEASVSDGLTTAVAAVEVTVLNDPSDDEAGEAPGGGSSSAVWINEFHYDNVGTDNNEFIEIMGAAGIDLDGYLLALYSGGQSGYYGAIRLRGIIPNQDGTGFGTIAFDAEGLQNGAPDGFGLVSPDNVCLEFIAYEGDMTADGGGPCNDVFGQDIGVFERNVSADYSLQRTGSGREAQDFVWVGPRLSSRGEINEDQTIGEPGDSGEPSNIGLLFGYTVAIGQVLTPDYDRPATWDDSDNDCISDRHEILIAQHDSGNGEHDLVMSSSGCSVISGRWIDPYDGIAYYSASDVEIDHVVALYESWISGLGNLTASEQRIFANTGRTVAGTKPETSHQFLAVGSASNSSKGSLDPAQWMPNESSYHCTYLKKWVLVKAQNDLLFDQAEFDYIASRENECDDTPLPELPENEEQLDPGTSLPDGPLGASVWINEFHYDNDGIDQGEFVEVAGPAGTDLTGWSLVLFNGFNDSIYNTVALTGTLADSGSNFGFLVIDFPANGIQNGAPDGMALIDNNGVCVELLSYEGRLSPNSGPCSEFLAVDIGVAEITTSSGGSTVIGSSLQRVGTGSVGPDFEWSGPLPNTKAQINEGQAFE